MDKAENRQSKIANWLRVIFWGIGIVFLWMGSAHYLLKILSAKKPAPGTIPPSLGDLATIFFGASSLALIIFSLIVAVAAMIQWQSFKNEIRRSTEAAIEAAMQARLSLLEKELRGRLDAVMGATIGALHSNPTAPTQREEDKDYIDEALRHAQRGYDRLKELEGNGKYMALNNVVYFSCLFGSDSKRDLLLTQGRELRDIAIKYEHLPHAAPYFMTFSRVQLVYGSEPNELKQALAIAKNLLGARLTNLQRKEATYLVASLTKKLAEISDPANQTSS